jgi:predicted LPLAT superfamily acyltransferase
VRIMSLLRELENGALVILQLQHCLWELHGVDVEAEIMWTIAGVAILTGRRIVRAWQTALSSSGGTQSAARMEESTWSHLLRMIMSWIRDLAHCDTPWPG